CVLGRRWTLSAGCIALACLFKVYPIAIGLLLAVVYGPRFAVRLALALLLGLAVPFALQEPSYVVSQYAGWLHHLQANDRELLSTQLWYRDLRLLCHNCHLTMRPEFYLAIQMIAAAGIAAYCWAGRTTHLHERRLLTALFALGCC